MQKEKLKAKRGITLIALVITIIVMLILVAATVTVALNGGLFQSAKKATADTEVAREEESELSNGRVKIDGKWYDSMEDYVAGVPSKDQPLTTYDKAGKKDGYLIENAEFTDGEYTAVIPKGFKISEEDGEGSIATGLVIKDANENEFVWIPVEGNLTESYTVTIDNKNYLEPKKLTGTHSTTGFKYDSQEELNYYYGYTDEGKQTPYYNYANFKYEKEYKEMVRQVNKYDGFYIGRYETTIDNGKIGSKVGTKVLTAGDILIQAPIGATETGTCYYRWWGLYVEQKKANVPDNGSNVQTAMIYGVLWDKTMDFINEKQSSYGTTTAHSEWHQGSSVVKSGENTASLSTQDKALNIWDLESNAYDWIQEANSSDYRVLRGRILPSQLFS